MHEEIILKTVYDKYIKVVAYLYLERSVEKICWKKYQSSQIYAYGFRKHYRYV